ncbi:hypothetical protein QFZ82_004679 [Streptomyces sp. V4I23]|nr:hypothetical protein [Streptomyces sp. V4I23]
MTVLVSQLRDDEGEWWPAAPADTNLVAALTTVWA